MRTGGRRGQGVDTASRDHGTGVNAASGDASAKGKKKKLTNQDADRGDAQKKGVQGVSDTWKRVSAKKKKECK